MAEMVGSAVVQETVSRAVSFVLSNREAAASKRHNIERLEMAHTNLEFALERSRKLPITDMSLLRQRRMVKRAYEECGDVLHRCKLRVLEDEKVEQGVTHSSLPKRIIHAVKLFISSSVSLKKDELTCSDVGRFEWFADKAGKFVRDMETGCSLAHYRFFSPFIRRLLERKPLWCKQVRGSRTNRLFIASVWSEERGVEAWIWFISDDRMTPKKKISLGLMLRLSESTDVVEITTKCLQSLGPVFKPFAEVAIGELGQLPTQRVRTRSGVRARFLDTVTATYLRPDPLCCRADGHGPCANDTTTSKFPAQVAFMCFGCYIPAFEYNLESSADGAGRNVVRDLPPLELRASIAPHRSCQGLQESFAIERIGGRQERINGSLRQMEEMLLTKAIDHFIRQPELTEYEMAWLSAHGDACFRLRKPSTEMASAPETKKKKLRLDFYYKKRLLRNCL